MSRPSPTTQTVQAVAPALNGNGNGNGNGHPNGKDKKTTKRWKAERDWGGVVARVLCALFALVGLIPLALGGLVRLDAVQQWAAERTAQLVHDQLGLDASYDLELRPWPLSLAMENVSIAASDGGTPVLKARSVIARPRIFSLLAGKVDFGSLDIEEPTLRVVLRDGKLVNLNYKVPETTSSEGSPDQEVPLSAVAMTNASIDITIDDVRVRSDEIDVDITLDSGPIEVSLRAERTEVDHRHVDPARDDVDAVDEDVLCYLVARVRISPDELLVRHLDLVGAADFDPSPGTRPACKLDDKDMRRVALDVASTSVSFADGKLESLHGRLKARVPAPMVHRFIDIAPVTGWVEVELDEASYDDTHQLPQLRGSLRADELSIDSKVISNKVSAEVAIEGDVVRVADLHTTWAGGPWLIKSVEIRPLDKGIPLEAHGIHARKVMLPDLLHDINVHPRSHVGWELTDAKVEHFSGTIDPPEMGGGIIVKTKDFGIYDRPSTDSVKRTMMAVRRGDIRGTIKVTPEGIVLSGMDLQTELSRVKATVFIGFDGGLGINVFEGSTVDLAEISPLVDIPLKGIAKVRVAGHGTTDSPVLEGEVSIDGFNFGGFPIGDVNHTKVSFVPLELRLTEAKLTHGTSKFDVPEFNVDFDNADADIVLDGRVDTRATGLHMVDLFEMIKLRDDPAWKDVRALAKGTAHVSFVLGGRRDRCGQGMLEVGGDMALSEVRFFAENYDKGQVEFDFLWDDFAAGDHGMTIDLHSAMLTKGSGTILAKLALRHNAQLQADVTATAIPLDQITAFQGVFGKAQAGNAQQRVRPEANVSFVAALWGTLDRPSGQADIDLSPMRIGPDVLPSSRFSLGIVPKSAPAKTARKTRCGNDVVAPAQREQFNGDPVNGVYTLAGQLFDGQIRFDDFELTQQKSALASGKVQLRDLDLGVFANLHPDIAFSASPPEGKLSADVHVDELPLAQPGLAEVRVFIKGLQLERKGAQLRVDEVSEALLLSGDALRLPQLPLHLRFPTGLKATLIAGGTVSNLSSRDPRLDISMRMPPIDLARLGVDIPQIVRAGGNVDATIDVKGSLNRPKLSGRIALEKGMLRIKDIPVPLDDINVELRIADNEVRIQRAKASAGNNGVVSMSGRMPLSGLDVAGASGSLVMRDVKIPVADGVRLTANATLNIRYSPSRDPKVRALPNITGTVSLTQFSYTRPMSFSVDLDKLTGAAPTVVETYKAEDDLFNFDITLVSPKPLRISNNLLDMRLDIAQPGIQLAGTDQRFGGRGMLRIQRGSTLFLSGHEFSIDDGNVQFDNPNRIAPQLDVHATTEYQRYEAAGEVEGASAASAAGGSSSGTSGRWRIGLHASGDIEEPKVRFTSDPPLSQDDIVLLLQVGMTRAELDRGLGDFAGVGLETLTTFSGLNSQVEKSLPLFDEVHVGSQYSSRSGRAEPTVTVGKRLTDDVRASVSTGLSEDREVRSSIEWKLSKGVSVQGRYDNANNVSSSAVGNIGADLRWRIEFE
jgi:translocation and assembly module TamB